MTDQKPTIGHEVRQWDGETGEKWVRHAEALDSMLSPFSDLIAEGALARAPGRCLDIGCGAGSLSLRLAEEIGHVTGVDVSRPLLGLARHRAEERGSHAQFIHHDAASFRPEKPADQLVSRYGVMFFDDPEAAFANLRTMLGEGGEMLFTCWREPKRNPWASLPIHLAEEVYGIEFPRPDPRAPGPFAFADEDYLRGLMDASGWRNVDLQPVEVALAIPGAGTGEAARFMIELGPLAGRLADAGIDTAPLHEALSKKLKSDETGQVRMPSEAWLVRAAR